MILELIATYASRSPLQSSSVVARKLRDKVVKVQNSVSATKISCFWATNPEFLSPNLHFFWVAKLSQLICYIVLFNIFSVKWLIPFNEQSKMMKSFSVWNWCGSLLFNTGLQSSLIALLSVLFYLGCLVKLVLIICFSTLHCFLQFSGWISTCLEIWRVVAYYPAFCPFFVPCDCVLDIQ